MSAVFIVSLLAGLLLGVYAMFNGLERRRPGASDLIAPTPPDQVSARLNLPAIAGFLTVFGAVGYPLSRELGDLLRLLIAAGAGALGAATALLVVARWAVPSAREEQVDARYLLQGHLAKVTVPIQRDAPGEITYEIEGSRFTAQALTLDGSSLTSGSEVVIERIEDGIAHVEAWKEVEQRL
jgi:membrane protein implicated in regulation of membrane protease activity